MGNINWLASYPKSGNTWTRLFLYNLLSNPEKPLDINSLSKRFVADSNKAWYEKAGNQPYDTYSIGQVINLRPKVHEILSNLNSGPVFVKTHSIYGTLYGVPLITPTFTARAIYIIRNPLDVVISFSSHFGLTIDKAIEVIGDPNAANEEVSGKPHIRQHYGSWSGHANSWTHFDRDRLHVMRYEDMLENPEETFQGMVKFLELDVSDDRLKKAIEFSSFDVARRQEDEYGFREQSGNDNRFFRSGKAGQWKEILSDKQIEKIIETHKVTMKYFGYLTEL
ncbi:sulfotransferase domain-containing protein [Sneathiella litorea]|uniref:Sulfotransferase domain-containing protein n=1 Tax=Sneathiella litorea TaxID=2606216 RepID=A0A6L8W445_9PROT|nr:sulfotransferase domain-containing protein [Sneathiella litorea]MZR29808.1 sulfotransferase domain-containing protein [Sneathiella litorea]